MTVVPEISITQPNVYCLLMVIQIIKAHATGNKAWTIIDWMVCILSTLTIPKHMLKATKVEQCMSVVLEISIREPYVYVILMIILIIKARATYNKTWTIIDWMVCILSTLTIPNNLLKATKLEQFISAVLEISIVGPKVKCLLMILPIIMARATGNKAWTIIDWMVCIPSTLTIHKNLLKATKLEQCMSVVLEISIIEPKVYFILMLILIIEARATWNNAWTIIDWMVCIICTLTIP